MNDCAYCVPTIPVNKGATVVMVRGAGLIVSEKIPVVTRDAGCAESVT